MTPEVTVALCTRDRAALLHETLDRLTMISVPARLTWEVVVVDNGSTDATPAVIERFAARLPLRSVREPRPGVAHARNAAVAMAAGTSLLWVDDDELVSPAWLVEHLEAARAYPDVEVFGGPILPWFEGWGTEAPPWLAAAMRTAPGLIGSYGAQDFGATPRLLGPAEPLWNGNLLVRTAAHRQVPYDTDLGRRPGSRMGGEDDDLLRRLRARGAAARWVPSAWVHHVIPTARQSVGYFRRHHQGYGERAILEQRREGRALGHGARWRLRARWLRHELRFRALRATSTPERWIGPLMISAFAQGQLREARRQRREDRSDHRG
jgi:glycosyltransferase involved in cell wall biosynthesis